MYQVIWMILSEDLKRLQLVMQVVELVQIAVVLSTLAGALIHTGYSLYGTIQIEKGLAKSDSESK